jgi:hypothetical protein
MIKQKYVYLRLPDRRCPHPARTSTLLARPTHALAYLPSNSLSKAEPGCSSESLPVFTSSEKAGPTPAPGWATGGTAEGSSGLRSALGPSQNGLGHDKQNWRKRYSSLEEGYRKNRGKEKRLTQNARPEQPAA